MARALASLAAVRWQRGTPTPAVAYGPTDPRTDRMRQTSLSCPAVCAVVSRRGENLVADLRGPIEE